MDSWLKVNCTKNGVAVDSISNDKAKQCLAGEDLLVECCESEKVVCLLMTDSKGNVFDVGEVVDVVRFGDFEKLLRVRAYVCRFVANLKSQKKGDELIVGDLPRFVKLKKCGCVMNNQLFRKKKKSSKS